MTHVTAEAPPIAITGIETIPLKIPYKPGHRQTASVWGAAGSTAVESLLVKVTTDQGWEGGGRDLGFKRYP